MKEYRVGVVALGFAGMRQVEASTKNPRTSVKAVCTRDEDKLRQYIGQYMRADTRRGR